MQTKARCWLFVSYLISFASVAGAGAVFISSIQHHAHVQMGVVRTSLLALAECATLMPWSSARPHVRQSKIAHLSNSLSSVQGCLLQAGFILASALLLWAFRTTETSDYMIY